MRTFIITAILYRSNPTNGASIYKSLHVVSFALNIIFYFWKGLVILIH